MRPIKTILYATDFSESSTAACAAAVQLAQLARASIHVLHVLAELSDSRKSMIQPEAFTLFEQEVEKQAVQNLETFCQTNIPDEVMTTTEIVHGTPFQEIITKALEINADLIVLGTHGRTGIEHVLVGSTAERVVRRSQLPVLTVRGDV